MTTHRSKSPMAAADSPQKVRGNMHHKSEITPLIMISTEAYRIQDPGIPFDQWRREEVQAAVGRGGLSECDHEHFAPLMGHFHAAAGHDVEAMHWFLKASKNTERQIAWSIAKILTDHIALAKSTPEQLAAQTAPRKLKTILAARAALLDHPEGPLDFGDLLNIVRGKTQRPTLTLDPENLAASLADRCDKLQLSLIRFTLTNRRNEREGRGHTSERNKSQRSPEARAARSPHTLHQRLGGGNF